MQTAQCLYEKQMSSDEATPEETCEEEPEPAHAQG